MDHPKTHAAFTLTELLIVMIVATILYGLAMTHFFPKKNGVEQPDHFDPTAFLPELFKENPAYRESAMDLYGGNEAVWLVVEGDLVRKIPLETTYEAYRLNPDETLQPVLLDRVDINGTEFRPLFHLRCRKDGYLDPAILRHDDAWIYVHPYLKPRKFSDAEEMVRTIRQSDYLPDRAGYAQ